MQTMAMMAQRNQNNGNKYAAAPAIASDVLRSLVKAVAKMMTTAIANAKVLVAATSKTIKYYSNIDPYDNKSFETKMK